MTNYRFSFAMCQRHAFLSGAGYGDLEVVKQADLDRFCDYDPPMVGSFQRMEELLNSAASLEAKKSARLRQPHMTADFADTLAEMIINGLTVSAFENDAGAASLLDAQRAVIRGTINRQLRAFLEKG